MFKVYFKKVDTDYNNNSKECCYFLLWHATSVHPFLGMFV